MASVVVWYDMEWAVVWQLVVEHLEATVEEVDVVPDVLDMQPNCTVWRAATSPAGGLCSSERQMPSQQGDPRC